MMLKKKLLLLLGIEASQLHSLYEVLCRVRALDGGPARGEVDIYLTYALNRTNGFGYSSLTVGAVHSLNNIDFGHSRKGY